MGYVNLILFCFLHYLFSIYSWMRKKLSGDDEFESGTFFYFTFSQSSATREERQGENEVAFL